MYCVHSSTPFIINPSTQHSLSGGTGGVRHLVCTLSHSPDQSTDVSDCIDSKQNCNMTTKTNSITYTDGGRNITISPLSYRVEADDVI